MEDKRPGQLTSTVTVGNAALVKDLLNNDRQFTVRGIAEELFLKYYKCSTFLQTSIICQKWLHVGCLIFSWKTTNIGEWNVLKNFLIATHIDRFLDKIVTTDETWLYYYDPESKQQSSIWKSSDRPPPKKGRAQRSCKKEMYIFSIDRHGLLLKHKV